MSRLRGSARAALLALAAMSLAGGARPAYAGGKGITVSTRGCSDLDQAEVERVLSIELADVANRPEGEPLRVELTCDARTLHILAIDPITDKRLGRDIELSEPEPGRDRTIALLISQLFLSSWSELLLEHQASPVLHAPVRHPPPPPEVRSDAGRLSRQAITPSDSKPRVGVSLAAGPRARSLGAPLLCAWIGLRPSLAVSDRVRLYLDLGYERGATSRNAGKVDVSLAEAALGLGFRSSRRATVALDLSGAIGATYIDAQGSPSGSAVGHELRGTGGQIALEAGPTFLFSPFRLGIVATGGVTFPRATARVDGGNADVSIAGAWIGAAIVLGVGETYP